MVNKTKKGATSIDMDDLSIMFDVDSAEGLPTQSSQPQKKDPSLKVINFLELENIRMEKLSSFMDTPLDTQKKNDLLNKLSAQLEHDLATVKASVVAKLSKDASALFQNIEYLWGKTFL